jgi:hypothetical protein
MSKTFARTIADGSLLSSDTVSNDRVSSPVAFTGGTTAS